MAAGEENAIDVEQRLHSMRRILRKELPLPASEAEVVMGVMARHAVFRNALQGFVLRGGVHHER